MGLTKFPKGVSSFGLPVIPGNEDGQVWGDTYFVDATWGSDSNDGKDPANAFAKIQAAVNACTTAKGDRIFIRNGAYAETLTITKDDIQLIGQSNSDVVVTGATDATDTLTISGNEVLVKNIQFAPYDTGDDISLIKITGDGCIIKNSVFSSGEYHIETNGADQTLIIGSHFITPHDTTDGACILLEDSNDCKVLFCSFAIDSNSDGIIHHDADNLEVGWCSAVGDDDTGASAAAFVFIVGSDGTSELMVHDCNATLFGALIAEKDAAVAAHGLGTSDLAATDVSFNNSAVGCTVSFDTTGLT